MFWSVTEIHIGCNTGHRVERLTNPDVHNECCPSICMGGRAAVLAMLHIDRLCRFLQQDPEELTIVNMRSLRMCANCLPSSSSMLWLAISCFYSKKVGTATCWLKKLKCDSERSSFQRNSADRYRTRRSF